MISNLRRRIEAIEKLMRPKVSVIVGDDIGDPLNEWPIFLFIGDRSKEARMGYVQRGA